MALVVALFVIRDEVVGVVAPLAAALGLVEAHKGGLERVPRPAAVVDELDEPLVDLGVVAGQARVRGAVEVGEGVVGVVPALWGRRGEEEAEG